MYVCTWNSNYCFTTYFSTALLSFPVCAMGFASAYIRMAPVYRKKYPMKSRIRSSYATTITTTAVFYYYNGFFLVHYYSQTERQSEHTAPCYYHIHRTHVLLSSIRFFIHMSIYLFCVLLYAHVIIIRESIWMDGTSHETSQVYNTCTHFMPFRVPILCCCCSPFSTDDDDPFSYWHAILF